MTCPRPARRSIRDDNRAVSTAVNYVLGLSIATILMTGLLLAGTGFVDDQRERTVRTELRVVSEQLADGVMTTDRLASTSGARTVVVTRDLPREVASRPYTIEVHGSDPRHVELSTSGPSVSVRVDLALLTDGGAAPQTPLVSSTVTGGEVTIVYNTTVDGCGMTGELEVCSG